MIRLALFDIDGTLIRTGGVGVRAFHQVFATEFGQTDGFENLKFAGRTDMSLVREFFTFHGIEVSPENFKRFYDRYVFWLDHLLQDARIEICAGVPEFIKRLRALKPTPAIGLLTGNFRLGAEIKLRRAGLWGLFEFGGFADDHEDRNEIAAVARERGCEFLGERLFPEQVLVIGDTPHDIRCARAIGAKVLAVGTGGATVDQLKQHHPDWLVPNLAGVSADEIAG